MTKICPSCLGDKGTVRRALCSKCHKNCPLCHKEYEDPTDILCRTCVAEHMKSVNSNEPLDSYIRMKLGHPPLSKEDIKEKPDLDDLAEEDCDNPLISEILSRANRSRERSKVEVLESIENNLVSLVELQKETLAVLNNKKN